MNSVNTSKHNKESGSVKMWLLSILGTVLILAALVWWMPHVVLGMFYTDLDSVNDSALALESIDIADERNAYYPLNDIDLQHSEILSEYRDEINDLALGDEWNREQAQEILTATDAVQQKFVEAATREAFQDPRFRDASAFQDFMQSQFPQDLDADPDVMNLSVVRVAARLQQIKSRILLEDGRYGEALDAALTNLRVGEMILNSQAPLIYNLVGLAVHQKGLDVMDEILAKIDDSRPSNLPDVAETLGATSISGFQNAYKILYQQNAFGHDVLADGGWEAVYGEPLDEEGGVLPADPSQIPFYFHPNRTKQIAANYYIGAVEKAKSQCWDEGGNYDKIAAYNELPEAEWKHKFIPNYVGKIMISTVPSMSGAVDNACEQQERAQHLSAEITALE